MRHLMMFVSFLSTSGAWIKVFSVEPDRFIFVFLAQFLIATSYTFTFGGSARLISTWFCVDETSRASAFSLFGDQVIVHPVHTYSSQHLSKHLRTHLISWNSVPLSQSKNFYSYKIVCT